MFDGQSGGLAGPYGSAAVIAFVNEKGGVAKTTSCINLAAALGALNKRILVIDLDPQANATSSFNISSDVAITHETHCLLSLARFPLERAIVPTRVPNVDLVPGSARLADCNKALVMEVGREARLRNKLREFYSSVLTDKYDLILIDCPPSLDLLTINALTAATHMIVPVTPKFYALKGMALLGDVVATLHEQLGCVILPLGILVTMFDKSTALDVTLYRLLKEKLEREYGEYLFSSVISRNVRIGESEAGGSPVVLRDPDSGAAGAYRDLAQEVVTRLQYGVKTVRPSEATSAVMGF
jgi:chromosome partitioning protein